MWLVLVFDINFFIYRSKIKLSYLVLQAANVGFGRVFALVSDSWLGKKKLTFLYKDSSILKCDGCRQSQMQGS